MRKKALREQLVEQGYQILAAHQDLEAAIRERDNALGQLQRIRIAHDPLYEAIFPPSVIRARE